MKNKEQTKEQIILKLRQLQRIFKAIKLKEEMYSKWILEYKEYYKLKNK